MATGLGAKEIVGAATATVNGLGVGTVVGAVGTAGTAGEIFTAFTRSFPAARMVSSAIFFSVGGVAVAVIGATGATGFTELRTAVCVATVPTWGNTGRRPCVK